MVNFTTFASLLLASVSLTSALTLQAREDLTTAPSTAVSFTSPNPLFVFKRQGCATGKRACGTGCIPDLTTNTCCTTYYCDTGRLCNSDGTCQCLSTEKKCGTGCIPTGASCCPLDLRYCDAGKYCSPVKGYCCNDGEDPTVCASRQGFTLPASVSTPSATSTFKPASSSTSVFVPLSSSTKASTSSSTPKPSSTSTSRIVVVPTTTPSLSSGPSSSSSSSSASTTSTPDVVILTVTASTSSSRTTSFLTVPSNAAKANGAGGVVGAMVVGVAGVLAVL